ncbi:MAG: RecX family transcriptional regulator [Eggerthellaceae bacterium]|nr:RecX family transcriptional regulator [Eggerthellaceae bacterium]
MAQELTPEQRAYQKILRLASVKEQSSALIRKRLGKDGYSPEVIDEALDRAIRASAINDRRYSEALIRTRIYAEKGIEPALKEIEEHRIDTYELEAYQNYLEEGEDAHIEQAVKFLENHPTRSKNLWASAYRKLVTRGFSREVASEAAKRWVREIT